jgi:hypothetical protein
MKKVASLGELQRRALATGATLEVGGEVFNAAGLKVTPKPIAPTPAPPPASVVSVPAPVAVSQSSMSRDELAEVLASRDAFWIAEIQRMAKMMTEGFLMAQDKPAPHGWRFEPHYHRGGLLSHIDATPRSGE